MRLFALAATAFLAFAGFAGFAAAQPYGTPEALIGAFYAPYFSEEFSDDDSAFRSEALQALYDADAEATPEGEIGALDFDPYISGQDWDLTDFEIGAAQVEGNSATVPVTFKNFGAPVTLSYELVQEDGGWKINDMASTTPGSEYRLSEIFADAEGDI